jgi:hypothetical protein
MGIGVLHFYFIFGRAVGFRDWYAKPVRQNLEKFSHSAELGKINHSAKLRKN